MRRFIDVDQVTDNEQFARLCTLEYLFQRVGAVFAIRTLLLLTFRPKLGWYKDVNHGP